MEIKEEENKPIIPESPSSPVPSSPGEEVINLNQLYPKAKQDLDLLFPESSTKKLLKEMALTQKRNRRFLEKIQIDSMPVEEEDETA